MPQLHFWLNFYASFEVYVVEKMKFSAFYVTDQATAVHIKKFL